MSWRSSLVVLCSVVVSHVVLMNGSAGQSPEWESGFWWITESHMYWDRSGIESGPRKMVDTKYLHKWVVEGLVKEGDERLWAIAIYPHMLPPDIVNDQGTEPIYRLWMRKDGLSLKRIQTNYRSGTYLVTGAVQYERTVTYTNANPVVMVPWPAQTCPLDVPVLPERWRERPLSSLEYKEYTAKDERIRVPITQRFDRNEGQTNEMVVVLRSWSNGNEDRVQKWTPNCPWWSEWYAPNATTNRDGLWYSKTIDWKGK